MIRPIEEWQRGARLTFKLGNDHGLYALFLCEGAEIPGVTPLDGGLIYLGKASGKRGIKGRCHFYASTANHSPRKSLAAMLFMALQLRPRLVRKPSSPDTWTLDRASEERLTDWMLKSLEFAFMPLNSPASAERELVRELAPPLNLNLCAQRPEHCAVTASRREMMLRAQREAVADPRLSSRILKR